MHALPSSTFRESGDQAEAPMASTASQSSPEMVTSSVSASEQPKELASSGAKAQTLNGEDATVVEDPTIENDTTPELTERCAFRKYSSL